MAWWKREPNDPGSTLPAPSPAPVPVQRSEWQQLRPNPPLVQRMSPIAPLDPFVASLATSHDPRFLGPLGHLVDPDGPSGTVTGLVAPGLPQTVHHGTELTVAPKPTAVQRMVQRVATGPRLLFGQSVSHALQRTDESEVETAPVVDVGVAQRPSLRTPAADVQRGAEVASDRATGTAVTPSPTPNPAARELPVVARSAVDVPTPVGVAAASPQESPSVSAPPSGDPSDAGPPPAATSDADHAQEPWSTESTATETHAGSTSVGVAPLVGQPAPTAPAVQRAAEPTVPAAPGLDPRLPPPTVSAALPLLSPAAASVDTTHSQVQRVSDGIAARPTPPVPGGPRADATPVAPTLAVARSVAEPDSTPDVSRRDSDPETADASPDAASPDVAPPATAPLVGLSHRMRAIDDPQDAIDTGGTSAVRSDPTPSASPATFDPPLSVVSPPPARRVGLGAPIPTGVPVQRMAADHVGPPADPPQTSTVPALRTADVSTGTDSSAPGTAGTEVTSHPLLGHDISSAATRLDAGQRHTGSTLPLSSAVQRHLETGTGSTPALVLPRSPEPEPEPPTAQRSMAAPPSTDQDFTSARPSFSDAMREDETLAPLSSGTTMAVLHAAGDPASQPPPVDGTSAAAGPGLSRPPTVQTLSSGLAAPIVQRDLAAGSNGSLGSRGMSMPTTGPHLQRTPSHAPGLGAPIRGLPEPTLPDPVTVRTMSLQRMFDPGAAAVANGVARPDGDNSVVFDPPTPTPLLVTGGRGTTAQRSIDTGSTDPVVPTAVGGHPYLSETAAPATVLSRPVALGDQPLTSGQAPSVQTAVDASPPPPTPASTGAAAALPTDLDELARRLFDPLSTRLKSELWMDRERAGMVTDLRR